MVDTTSAWHRVADGGSVNLYGAATSRRHFLGSTIGLALAASMPRAFAATTPPVGARARGKARIDVRDHGAKGNGANDDTSAFQRAIDALPADGGTVLVPAGAYVIDPTRSVRLRSRMRLAMADGATLLAKANASARAYVLTLHRITDVEVSGGRIVGDRDAHLGTTGEWGHGVMVRASARITLRGIAISRCWGDGISIGGDKAADGSVTPSSDVVIADVACTRNRRQGLTIGRSRQVRVYDSEFSGTGGTRPGAGIDVEPDAGDIARDVRIERCAMRDNEGPGLALTRRVSGATVRNCTIEDNHDEGIFVAGAVDCTISGNVIRGNGLPGVNLRGGSRNVLVSGNRFAGNGHRRRPAAKASERYKQVVVVAQTHGIRVAPDNRYEAR